MSPRWDQGAKVRQRMHCALFFRCFIYRVICFIFGLTKSMLALFRGFSCVLGFE